MYDFSSEAPSQSLIQHVDPLSSVFVQFNVPIYFTQSQGISHSLQVGCALSPVVSSVRRRSIAKLFRTQVRTLRKACSQLCVEEGDFPDFWKLRSKKIHLLWELIDLLSVV